MAKLNAYGRTELYRVEKTTLGDDGRNIRRQYALMSDRTVLSRTTWYLLSGKVDHASNWQMMGKLVSKITPEEWFAKRQAEGYTL